eukprot:1190002-Prorocentrum_minimum.AAC.4
MKCGFILCFGIPAGAGMCAVGAGVFSVLESQQGLECVRLERVYALFWNPSRGWDVCGWSRYILCFGIPAGAGMCAVGA